MSVVDATPFTIGYEVSCADGLCGKLTRVVVDPVAETLTHLVVDPKHGGIGRLVPVDLVDSADEEIELRCTSAEFEKLAPAEETQFLPGASGNWSYGQDQMISWPYFGLGMGGMGAGGIGLGSMDARPQTITTECIPVGEIELHRGDQVHATDGDIGHVHGLVVDSEHRVTHVLLEEGHLWGKKEVAIPIGDVSGIGGNGVRLNLTKSAIGELPAVGLEHAR